MIKRVPSDITRKLAHSNAEVRLNESLKEHTTFNIGGRATAFVVPADADALCHAVTVCCEYDIPFMILGRGSNVLFPDGDLDMVIISTMGINAVRQSADNLGITAGAGALLKNIADYALKQGLIY